ncbi:MAG: enoyl-CoA hydratase/isomerase family protein [Chloroflexi bacterium]|nr:enoyl-CoA hydratase/isomerase family protein [Chloroflexota bacterium]
MKYENIILEKADGIARLTLNRPHKRNAMSRALLREFDSAIDDVGHDPTIRVLVIKGAGKVFCAGFDLTDPEAEDHENMPIFQFVQMERESGYRTMDRWLRLWNLPQAVIAQVQGHCLAGGCELAMICDITIAAEDAVIGYPVSRMGVSSRHIFPWVLGMKRTKELLFTGNTVSGKEADRIGMINHAVPADKLEEEVDKLARRIAEMPLELIQLHKASTNKTFEIMGFKSAIDYGLELHPIGHITDSRSTFDKTVKEKGLKAAVADRDKSS